MGGVLAGIGVIDGGSLDVDFGDDPVIFPRIDAPIVNLKNTLLVTERF